MTWEDIDLERGLIYVTKSVSWAGKNQGTLKKPKSDNGKRAGRHTVATFMNNADVDEKTITSQIGHHDIAFTRKQYMNAQMRQMQRSMDKLGNYIENIQ